MELPFKFQLTEDEEMMLSTIQEFKRREKLEERILAWNAKEECPLEVYRKAGHAGFFAHYFPKQYGGLEATERSYALTAIAFCEDVPELYSAWAASFGLFGFQVLEMGTEEQKERYLPGIISGEKIGAFCLTEPQGGSNALKFGNTTLQKKGGKYVLNGEKTFITNGTIADYYYVLCREGEKGKKESVRSVIVPKEVAGVSATKIKGKMGWRCADTATVYFENVEVPEENLVLGRPSMSAENAVDAMHEHLIKERTGAIYVALGVARGVVKRITSYLESRELERGSGRVAAITFPLVQERLREMIGGVAEKQRVVFSIVDDIERKQKFYCIEDVMREKISTVRMAMKTADEAIQLAGGYGYLEESHFPRFSTFAKVLSIGAGTEEVQKEILYGLYGLPRAGKR